MSNAKTELLQTLEGKPKVKCAMLRTGENWSEDDRTYYLLKLGYKDEDFTKFIESLDFNYDSGYGGQNLFGTLWFEDGTWLSRGEYDGSEWWEYNIVPELPPEII